MRQQAPCLFFSSDHSAAISHVNCFRASHLAGNSKQSLQRKERHKTTEHAFISAIPCQQSGSASPGKSGYSRGYNGLHLISHMLERLSNINKPSSQAYCADKLEKSLVLGHSAVRYLPWESPSRPQSIYTIRIFVTPVPRLY